MSTTIITRTIGGLPENAAQMLNSDWARPVALPPGWQKIRLGIRVHWTNTGLNLTGNPIFAMGFNSGLTNLYGDATTQNFIGMAFDTATWTWGAGNSTFQIGGNQNAGVFRTRIGTTNNDATIWTNADAPLVNAGASSNASDRMILFVDVTKGSPNYSVSAPFRCFSGGGQPGNVTPSNFLLYMSQLVPTPNEGGYNLTFLATRTFPFSEIVNGTLDCVNFYWNRPDVFVEICDVAVAVLA